MRIRARLQLLEVIASALTPAGDVAAVEIWIPDNHRGGPPPWRHPCAGSRSGLVIYDPAETVPPVAEALP